MIMEVYTLDQIKDEVYGVKGTPRRDTLEKELANLRVGLQIRNMREEKKMTQLQLAEKIGKERSFISKVETDGKNLTIGTLFDIVERGLGATLNIQILPSQSRAAL